MGLVGQNQQTTFTNPQNGQAPDADVIRGNDNAVTAKHNTHDADATIHVQTGLLSARPIAGTPYAMYLDENRRLYVDNGSAWSEVPYARLDAAGTNAFTNNVSVGGNLTVVAGLTDVLNIDAQDIVADSATIAGAVSAASASISGTVAATTFSGSGASLTNLPAANLTGTLPAISGANLTNLNASNLATGTVAMARIPTTLSGLSSVQSASFSGSSGSTTALVLDNSSGTMMTIPTGSGFRKGNNGSPNNWAITGPATLSTYNSGQDDLFLLVQSNGLDYYIRLERWT